MHLNLTKQPNTFCESQSQKTSTNDLLASSRNDPNTQNGIQYNGNESFNEFEDNSNLQKNLDKFTITSKTTRTTSAEQLTNISKFIAKDLDKLMHQKIKDFK